MLRKRIEVTGMEERQKNQQEKMRREGGKCMDKEKQMGSVDDAH